MSVTQVGTANTDGADAGDGVTLTKPTGVASGDFLIVFVNFVDVHTLTPPSGWTLVESILGSSGSLRNNFYTKTAGGSEPSSYTFSQGSGNNGIINGGIVALRESSGAALSLNVHESDSLGSGTNVSTPSATSTLPGRHFQYRASRHASGANASYTQSWGTELWDIANDGGAAEYGQILAIGISDASAGTQAGTTINSTDSATINIVRHFVIGYNAGTSAPATVASVSVSAKASSTSGSAAPTAGKASVSGSAKAAAVSPGLAANPTHAQVVAAAYLPGGSVIGLPEAAATAYNATAGIANVATVAAVSASAKDPVAYFGAPEDRQYHVEAEDRTMAILDEQRSYVIPLEE